MRGVAFELIHMSNLAGSDMLQRNEIRAIRAAYDRLDKPKKQKFWIYIITFFAIMAACLSSGVLLLCYMILGRNVNWIVVVCGLIGNVALFRIGMNLILRHVRRLFRDAGVDPPEKSIWKERGD
jgi:hypothetical protein